MYYESVFKGLNEKGVRYLVVGGMAVVLHGIVRLTADLDIVIDFRKDNVLKLVDCMEELGYKPRVPVAAIELADEERRKNWIEEKNMEVFSFLDTKNQLHLVDVLIKNPLDFEGMYGRRKTINAGGIDIPVVSIADLVKLKKIPGREKDLEDLRSIKKMMEIRDGD
jgi:predicted nucleotidyltransferase